MGQRGRARLTALIVLTLLLVGGLSLTPAADAALAVVTRTVGDSRTTAGTSHTVTLNGTASAGELLFACIVGVNPIGAWSWGTWTEVFEYQHTNGSHTVSCARKTAAGGETTETVTSTGSNTSKFAAWRISGQHASSAPECGSTAEGSSTTPDPPSLTASWGAEANFWIALATSPNNHTFSGFPSGYGNTQNEGTDGNTNIGTAELASSNATENPGTFSMPDGGSWLAQTCVFRPAATCQAGSLVLLGVGC